jgi:hypothetical protein
VDATRGAAPAAQNGPFSKSRWRKGASLGLLLGLLAAIGFGTVFAVLIHRASGLSGSRAARSSTPRDADREYEAQQSHLQLPIGDTWPSAKSAISQTGRLPSALGVISAQDYWWCAWTDDWLQQKTGSSASVAALHELNQVTAMQLYRTAYDHNTQLLTRRQLGAARRGDPRPLQSELAHNCPAVLHAN